MVAEVMLWEREGNESFEFLSELKPAPESAIFRISPGDKQTVILGNQEVEVSCAEDNKSTSISYILEDSPLKPRNTQVLLDSDKWYPIPGISSDLWLLVRHKDIPSRSEYFNA